MLSTRSLLFLLFTFPAAVFQTPAQQADNTGPIRRDNITSHCSRPLQGHTPASNALLVANRTVVSLIVEDNLVDYFLTVSVGSPYKYYKLSVDTGSANTVVGVTSGYSPTSLSMNTTQAVFQSYADNSALGFEFFDVVALGSGCVVLNQSISIAKRSVGFASPMDGILGIGPTQLTKGTLYNQTGQSIPTITDTLATLITPARMVGLSFRPWNESNVLTSEVTWGGIDQSHFVGPLIYVPITKTQPAGSYVGINASIFYDNKPLLSNGAGIIDSGRTVLQLSADVFDAYTKAAGVTGGSGYSSISTKNYEKLKPLVFVIGNSSFALTPDGQRFPPSVCRKYFPSSCNPSRHFIPINTTNESSGKGSDFVLGIPWLRRFYVVYDSDNARVGVANTSYTDAIVN